ncbi:FG-GAP-like repeat-containing protein [Streptomyces sp. HMX112]|uniref:FG-GAP-like repeat-containing protein n=1 Tax=Streptomyces sp. HMX112 TaxID=3390850 RepID=UPI003A80F486
MHRGSLFRRTAATAVVLSVGAGLGPLASPLAYAADPPVAQEAVLPAGARFLPRDETLVEAGATGFLHQQEGSTGRLWTDYATGRTRGITPAVATGHSGMRAALGQTAPDGTRPVAVTDLATGEVTTVTMPAGYIWSGAYTADSVTAYRLVDGLIGELSVLRTVDGATRVSPVEGVPAGVKSIRTHAQQQDGRGAVLVLTAPDRAAALHLLDYATARLTALPKNFAPGGYVALGERHLLTWPYENATVTTLDRNDPQAAPVTLTMPAPAGPERTFARFAVVGDWIVFSRLLDPYAKQHTPGGRLQAMPVTGGEPRELLRYSDEHFAAAPDGSVLVTGGSGAKDWAVRRVTAGPDGAPVLSTVHEVAPVTARIHALALGGGKLSYVSDADGGAFVSLYDHDVAVTGTPAPGERALRFRLASGVPTELSALGNGRTGYASPHGGVQVPIDDTSLEVIDVPAGSRIVDATGRYSVIDAPGGPQHIGDLGSPRNGHVALTRPSSAATVWGTTLWTPGRSAGTVAWYDLKSKKTSPDLALGSGCVPNELQAVGRWVHWTCGSGASAKAGVWDQKTRTSTPVPAGRARLGDGFLVREEGERLLLTDFHTATGAAATTPFADVPGDAPWAVDKFGGHVAYTDAEQRIRIKPVTVPRSPVGLAESEVEDWIAIGAGADHNPAWDGAWQLSRPPVRWSVAIKDAAGRTVRTIASAERAGARISVSWDGRGDDGRIVSGGPHTWTLSADAGEGTRVVQGGRIAVSGGATGFRDYGGNGVAELFTKQAATLSAHEGMTAASESGASLSQRGGWSDVNQVLPFGDMDGDRCNDLVVRTTAGDLDRYSGRCQGVPAATGPKVRIGSGFNAFDALVTPGDLTGDGRADLLARQRSTGALYLYADNGAGALKGGVRLAGSFTGLTLVGAGDLTGDGHGDLLARDAGGELWRYDGTGTGALRARVLVFKDWGAGRNAFVGAGDIDGDGRNDLVSRDTSGKLMRNSGDGKGSFGGTVVIGTGWQRYGSIH